MADYQQKRLAKQQAFTRILQEIQETMVIFSVIRSFQ